MTIRRALLSVSDKTGLADFARFLHAQGIEILSTGGTASALRAAGIPVKDVSAHTGSPEIMDGRVKTLHPAIHGGILAVRDDAAHLQAMNDHAIAPIDLVAINLYPFEKTVAKGAAFDDCIENIDIGGPAMIRSAAKNHAHVTVLVDPADYAAVMQEIEAGKDTSPETRRRLAAKAFTRTASYDGAISQWFAALLPPPAGGRERSRLSLPSPAPSSAPSITAKTRTRKPPSTPPAAAPQPSPPPASCKARS